MSTGPRMTLYGVVVVLVGLPVAGGVIVALPAERLAAPLPVVLLLVAALGVAELFPVPFARNSRAGDEVTVSTTFGLSLLLLAPVGVVVLAHAVALLANTVRSRRPWGRLPFDIAKYALSYFAARAAYADLADERFGSPGMPVSPDLAAFLFAGLVFFLVNNCLVSVAIAAKMRTGVRHLLVSELQWQAAISGPLIALAPVIAYTVAWNPWALLLLLSPVLAVHRAGHLAVQREQEALHDSLTGLPNRTQLRAVLTAALKDTSRTRQVALLLVDLDHFKDINDTFGHGVGDGLLQQVAARLSDAVRPEDLVARLGGDEFAVLCCGLQGPMQAEQVAARVTAALSNTFDVGDLPVDVGVSTGIALSPLHGRQADELLRRADIALYVAKEVRGRYAFFEPHRGQHAPARLDLLGDLRRALEQPGELFVVFQPQVDAPTRDLIGVEALVRWQHPQRGLLSPDIFIPVAESTGLIDALTRVVLDLALEQAARWWRAGLELKVSVNLSVLQLADVGFADMVGSRLAEVGLPPERLVLEVTESRLMADPERSVAVLAALRAAGVGLSIDDFGTGYSSLTYLSRLDVDEIKIDKSFSRNLARNESDGLVVRATIDLGHRLGLRVVAEGVEDPISEELLRDWGCDVLQGYHISRPVSAEAIQTWDSDRRAAAQAVRRAVAGRAVTAVPAV